MDLRILGIKGAVELLEKKQSLLYVDPVAFPPGRPAEMVRRIGSQHMGQEYRDRSAIDQTASHLEPVRGVVSRSPLIKRSLKFLPEVPQGKPAPMEQPIARSFGPAEQFDIEHV